jgi:hypothetical protein
MGREADLLRKDMARLEKELRTARDMVNGDFWYWQGNGDDNLESLVCPRGNPPRGIGRDHTQSGGERRCRLTSWWTKRHLPPKCGTA